MFALKVRNSGGADSANFLRSSDSLKINHQDKRSASPVSLEELRDSKTRAAHLHLHERQFFDVFIKALISDDISVGSSPALTRGFQKGPRPELLTLTST